uniref:Uncharacterized protein n=1 Tax=Leersia perrieri TaxID=77586 RepID=A0A0D9XNP9_9ORYZ
MSAADGNESPPPPAAPLKGGAFGDPCLDLFFLIDDGGDTAPAQHLIDLLAAAWESDALTTLKLVCTLGKRNDMEAFYTAALWVHQNHPRTLAANLPAFADLGPELLYRIVRAEAGVRRKRAREDDVGAGAMNTKVPRRTTEGDDDDDKAQAAAASCTTTEAACTGSGSGTDGSSSSKALKAVRLAKLALDMYRDDDNYRFLFNTVRDFFVQNLRSDLNSSSGQQLSNVAKWCPSPDSAFDQTTLLSDAIARGLFPRESYANLTEENYIFLVHRRLRQDVFVQLLKPLAQQDLQSPNKPEIQPELPPDIARFFTNSTTSPGSRDRAVEQWTALVDALRANGSLRNCLAVCDVRMFHSGDGERPKLQNICASLGLLISELSVHPWTNYVHAFRKGRCPRYIAPQQSYENKMEFLLNMRCDDNFSLRNVCRWIYKRARDNTTQPKDMVRTIFVLTDKGFDDALVPPVELKIIEDFDPKAPRPWREEYPIICDRFKKFGFESLVPQIVLWNLRGPRSACFTSTKGGIMTLSGYSDQLMRLFLENDGIVHPEDEMSAAFADKEYHKLHIID